MADGKWQMAKSHKGHGKTRWGYASSRYFKVSFFRRAIRMRILGCNGRAKVRICSLMFAYVRIFEKKFATEAPRHRGSIQWQAEFDTTKNHGRVVDSLAPARSALAGLHLRSNGAPALAKCFPGLDGRCRDMQTFRRFPSGSSHNVHNVHIVRDCPSAAEGRAGSQRSAFARCQETRQDEPDLQDKNPLAKGFGIQSILSSCRNNHSSVKTAGTPKFYCERCR